MPKCYVVCLCDYDTEYPIAVYMNKKEARADAAAREGTARILEVDLNPREPPLALYDVWLPSGSNQWVVNLAALGSIPEDEVVGRVDDEKTRLYGRDAWWRVNAISKAGALALAKAKQKEFEKGGK